MPISTCEEVLLSWKLVSVSICYLIKVAHLIPFTQHYVDSFQVIQTKYDIFVMVKGTVSVISSDSQCKKSNARFKALSDQLCTFVQFVLKGTVRVISSDPPCKARDVNARFTTVPLNLSMIKNELDIHSFVYSNCLFSFVVSLQKILPTSNYGEIHRNNTE